MIKNKISAKKGITLVSLVITVVVLLILAGVAISISVDDDGVFGKAEGAVNKWNEKVAEESQWMENILAMGSEHTGGGNGEDGNGDIKIVNYSVIPVADGAKIVLQLEMQGMPTMSDMAIEFINRSICVEQSTEELFVSVGEAATGTTLEPSLVYDLILKGNFEELEEIEYEEFMQDKDNYISTASSGMFKTADSFLRYMLFSIAFQENSYAEMIVQYGAGVEFSKLIIPEIAEMEDVESEIVQLVEGYYNNTKEFEDIAEEFLQGLTVENFVQLINESVEITEEENYLLTKSDVMIYVAGQAYSQVNLICGIKYPDGSIENVDFLTSTEEYVESAGYKVTQPGEYKITVAGLNGKTEQVIAEVKELTLDVAQISEELPEGWSSTSVDKVALQGSRNAPIPVGYVVSGIANEKSITNGLVIYKKTGSITEVNESNHPKAIENCDQYVWVPVDDITDMVMCKVCGDAGKANLDKTTLQCKTCGEATKLAGKLLYNETYGDYFDENVTGQVYDESRFHEPAVITGDNNNEYDASPENYHGLGTASAFLTQLEEDFTKMAKSVAKYGGFYISRYEMGLEGSSKRGQTVLSQSANWWDLYKALRSNTEDVTSTYSQMMWDCQYDQLMCLTLEKSRTDGTGQEYNVHNTNWDRHTKITNGISGNNRLDLICNVYDLEANCAEYTSGAYDNEGRSCRGGITGDAYYSSACHRAGGEISENGRTNGASRATLYVAL